MATSAGLRWNRLANRGPEWDGTDGPCFNVLELVREFDGVMTQGAALRWLDYGLKNKGRRLPYKVIRRGPIKDVVIPVVAWMEYMAAENPDQSPEWILESARRMVLRTYRKREGNKAYPLGVLAQWLRETSPARNKPTDGTCDVSC